MTIAGVGEPASDGPLQRFGIHAALASDLLDGHSTSEHGFSQAIVMVSKLLLATAMVAPPRPGTFRTFYHSRRTSSRSPRTRLRRLGIRADPDRDGAHGGRRSQTKESTNARYPYR